MIAPVYKLDETIREPQVISNETVITIKHGAWARYPASARGLRLPGTLDITERLLNNLGYTASAIEEFRSRQII